MYEKMKYLVAEDGLAPSAYRQVNCDLCHIPPSLCPGGVCVMREENDRKEKGEMTRMDFRRYLYTFRMILFYASGSGQKRVVFAVFDRLPESFHPARNSALFQIAHFVGNSVL